MEERTQLGVLVENLQRDMRVMAEGQGAAIERLDRHEIWRAQVERWSEQITIHVAVLDAKLNALESRMKVLEPSVAAFDPRRRKHRPPKRRRAGGPRT
jgi:hypothetical protein